MVSEVGAIWAAFGGLRTEHEVVYDELSAAFEEVGEADRTAGGGELVGFGDGVHGQGLAFFGKGVASASQFFFFFEKRFAGLEPFRLSCDLLTDEQGDDV